MSEKLVAFDWDEALKDLRRVRRDDGCSPTEACEAKCGYLFIRWDANPMTWICHRRDNTLSQYRLRLLAPPPRIVWLQLYRSGIDSRYFALEAVANVNHAASERIGEPFEREVPGE